MKFNYQLILPAFLIVALSNFQPVSGQGKATTVAGAKSITGGKANWTIHPFDHQIFIENKGQFVGPKNGEKILYGAQVSNLYAFITPHGLVYKYTERPEVRVSPDGKKYESVDPDELLETKKKPIDHYLTATWVGSNPNITTVAGKEQTYYYTYVAADGKSTIKVNVFKTITCLNVYPGIDIRYMFPKGKTGIKYNLIVHPGADLSVVKLKYDETGKMSVDKDGNININSGWGQFVDHAPKSFYKDDHSVAVSNYDLKDNEESFNVKNLDVTKSLVVDPWSTNWTDVYAGNSGYDGAYDLDFDYAGNVYIYGGYNPFVLSKYNKAGVLQWTFNTPFPNFYYGDFCVDKASGVSFAFEGFGGGGAAYTDKISTTGALITQLTANTLDEQWRATYDLCSHTIAIAGGGVSQSFQAATLDTNLLTYNQVNIMNLPPNTGLHDLCLIGSDPIADTVYMGAAHSLFGGPADANEIYRLPMPSLAPSGLLTPDKLNFWEVNSVTYVATGLGNTNGMNGMAISPNWFYVYDGDTLRQIDKNTGLVHNSVSLSSTYFAWGGLDVDLCDNIYAGNATNVDIYSAALAHTGTIGPFPGNVFDVVLGNGLLSFLDSTLYVCGKGFLSSIKIDPPSPPTIVKTRTHVCSCNCTASATLDICGVPYLNGVTYLWSGGQTTSSVTGLCPGNTYTVTIKLGCALQYQDTIIMPNSGTMTLTKTQTSATCATPGSATIAAAGGIAPYTYLWSNAATTSSISGLGAGNYCVTVTDNHGCQDSACFIIPGVGLPTITITPSPDSICAGGSVGLTAAGALTYVWTPPGSGLSCYNCANPTASPLATTTYTVVGTDGSGCKNKDSVVVKVNPSPVVTVKAVPDTVCAGGTINITATGGGTYAWNPAALGLSCYNCATPISTPTATTTYTVTVTNVDGCSTAATITVFLAEPPSITVKADRSSICQGQSVTMNANATNITGPYTWQPGGMTSPIVTVSPTVTTTYTVSASSACGTASETVTISVNPAPVVYMAADIYKGCMPLCIQFRNSSTITQGAIARYVWEFGNGDSLQSKTPVYCYPNNGMFNVTLSATSDSGCSSTLRIVNMITVYSRPNAAFSYSPQSTDIMQPTIQFTDNTGDVYGVVAWTWTFGDATDSTSSMRSPEHTYQDTGTYCPTLIAMNQHGCLDTATNCLVIDPIFTLYIPSAFSPNGDAKNDVFMAKGNDIKSFEMYIFDRWGMQLFHSTDINKGWNGRVSGGSDIAQEDTYVYMITAYDSKNKKHTYTGNINLIK